jgi:hypothetical protein
VGILNPVQQHDKPGFSRYIVQRQRSGGCAKSDDSLMRLAGRSLIERCAGLEANGDFRPPAKIHDFLNSRPPGAPGNQKAVERPSCPQCLSYRVDPDQDAHGPMLPGAPEKRLKADLPGPEITH